LREGRRKERDATLTAGGSFSKRRHFAREKTSEENEKTETRTIIKSETKFDDQTSRAQNAALETVLFFEETEFFPPQTNPLVIVLPSHRSDE